MLTRLLNLPLSGFIDTPLSSIKEPVLYVPSRSADSGLGILWKLVIETDGFSIDTYGHWQNKVRERCTNIDNDIISLHGWPKEALTKNHSNIKNFMLLSLEGAQLLSTLPSLYPSPNSTPETLSAIKELMVVANASGYLSDGVAVESMRRRYHTWSPMFDVVEMTPLHTFSYSTRSKAYACHGGLSDD